SRGCPYRCSFCQVTMQPDVVRIRTKVDDDLTYLISNYNPGFIHFVDELIPYYDDKWRDSWGRFKHPFIAYIRADIPEKWLIWLKDRGLSGCFFGVESGNEDYRNKVLGKNLLDKDIIRTVALLKEMEIPFMASYMRGTPGESWEMQAQTMALSKILGGYPVFYQYEKIIGSS
ncbi:MAG: radical SAM protein, partial [bacterium]